MSSFNYFSPSSRNSNRNLFGPSSSPSPHHIAPSPSPYHIAPSPSPSHSPSSCLNPTASSYIPLNAGAAPYVPLSPQIVENISKPLPPPKKTPYPSFTYYTKMNSAPIYNATSLCRQRSEYSSSACSDISLSSMATPCPASVTSSVYSECNSIDLDNIEPYIPNNKRLDIDLVYTQNTAKPVPRTGHKLSTSTAVISEDVEYDTCSDQNSISSSDESIHPVIAALTDEESAKLLNAPIWSPANHINDNDEEEEEEKEECIHFSKIAMDEEDYQYIMHPNKKPVKYGYIDANRACNSKVAMDDNIIYPPHIQYMQRYQYGGSYIIQQEIGEKYDEYTQQLVVASNITTCNDGYTETNTMTVQSTITKTATLHSTTTRTTTSQQPTTTTMKVASDDNHTENISPSDPPTPTIIVSPATDNNTNSSHSASTFSSNIAPADPAPLSMASDISNTSIATKNYYTKRSNKHLYTARASRVAMEGYDNNHDEDNNNNNIDTIHSSKVAMDFMSYNYHETNYYNSLYSESRVASPNIQQISYIYCRS